MLKTAALTMLTCVSVACHRDVTSPPAVPLILTVQAHQIDNAALPVILSNAPWENVHLLQYTVMLTEDGLWSAHGISYPEGATSSSQSSWYDNGFYLYDGSSLRLHSNFSHTDWSGTVVGDTITVTAVNLVISNLPHDIVLWP